MKIQVLSDLHLEGGRKVEDFPVAADVLVLAGDVNVGPDRVIATLGAFKARGYKHIFFVFGNHEFYRHDRREVLHEVHAAFFNDPVVHILHQTKFQLEDITFIGDTLWTNFRNDWAAQHNAQHNINDFYLIQEGKGRKFLPRDAVREFEFGWNFIRNEVNNPGKKVVITHFLPAIECIHRKYWYGGDQRKGLLNAYFANDLGHYLADMQNVTWIHGHTHDPVDIQLGNTRVVCNPIGYLQHREDGIHDFTIEV